MQSSKKRAWLTPDTEDALAELICKRVFVPNSPAFRESVRGALLELTHAWNWEQYGSMTPEETALKMLELYNMFALDDACSMDVPAPFWDAGSDADAEAPADAQTWYGYITNPSAAEGELTFFESAAIWTFTGFLALATPELGFAPAILFNTIAPKFALAVRRGDVGEIIRILIDGQDAAAIDTSSAAVGDVVKVDLTPAPAATHEIIMVQVG